MRLHRFIGDFDLSKGRRIEVRDAALANQLANVLRLHEGGVVVLCDGRALDAMATIVAIGKSALTFELHDTHPSLPEPAVRVTLCAALLKRENFELIAQKAVEAGVAEIVPILSNRTIKQGIRLDRLRKIAHEAAEQSGRGIIPMISEPMTLSAAFDRMGSGYGAFFDLDGAAAAETLAVSKPANVTVFIGPEGGWDATEREEALSRGCAILTLGPRTLRAETAAIVATYLAASVH